MHVNSSSTTTSRLDSTLTVHSEPRASHRARESSQRRRDSLETIATFFLHRRAIPRPIILASPLCSKSASASLTQAIRNRLSSRTFVSTPRNVSPRTTTERFDSGSFAMSTSPTRGPEAKRARTMVTAAAGADDDLKPTTTADAAKPLDNSFLASLHAERMRRRGLDVPVSASTMDGDRREKNRDLARAIATHAAGSKATPETLDELRTKRREAETAARAAYETVNVESGDVRLLTYNVWFGDVATVERLEALGAVITECDPHVLCLQEVTPQALFVLRDQEWWEKYSVGPSPPLQDYFSLMLFKRTVSGPLVKREKYPFRNSRMGRYLDVVSYMRDPTSKASLAVGSSHLESYINPRETSAEERRVQIAECFSWLNKHGNAVFMGDTNWDDKDGDVPMPEGWCDAWLELRPGDPGYTYDAKSNEMLRGYLRKRLDRAFVKLKDFDLKRIEMVGTKPIPGVTYRKTVSNRGKSEIVELPVVPSDHFGLLLTLRAKKRSEPKPEVDAVDLT